jgi:hypothetical protein
MNYGEELRVQEAVNAAIALIEAGKPEEAKTQLLTAKQELDNNVGIYIAVTHLAADDVLYALDMMDGCEGWNKAHELASDALAQIADDLGDALGEDYHISLPVIIDECGLKAEISEATGIDFDDDFEDDDEDEDYDMSDGEGAPYYVVSMGDSEDFNDMTDEDWESLIDGIEPFDDCNDAVDDAVGTLLVDDDDTEDDAWVVVCREFGIVYSFHMTNGLVFQTTWESGAKISAPIEVADYSDLP